MSSEAMQKALAAAKAEAGKGAKAKADKTGKAVQTASDAPVTQEPVEKVVADATPALKAQTEEIVAGAEALNEVLTPGNAELVIGDTTVPVTITEVDADGIPTLDEASSEAVGAALGSQVNLTEPDAGFGYNNVENLKTYAGEVLTDTIRLQHPSEGTPKPPAFAAFDRLPPVRGSHPTFKG